MPIDGPWYDDPRLCPDWVLAEKLRLQDEADEEIDWDARAKDARLEDKLEDEGG